MRRTRRQRRRTAGLIFAAAAAATALAAAPRRPLTPDEARAERSAHAARLGEQELEAAIDHYRRDHGALPGQLLAGDRSVAPSAEVLVHQLTWATNTDGAWAPAPEPDHPHGPYLPAGLPVNPANGLRTVRIAWEGTPVDGATGWSIDPTNGAVSSNAEAGR